MRLRVVVILLVLLVGFPIFAGEKIRIPCEVLEVSGKYDTNLEILRKMHYVLIHHANAADRETLSKWLKDRSGTEVVFIVKGIKYHGILCRLSHCFGRGLLIHMNNLNIKKRDIIEVVLPASQ